MKEISFTFQVLHLDCEKLQFPTFAEKIHHQRSLTGVVVKILADGLRAQGLSVKGPEWGLFGADAYCSVKVRGKSLTLVIVWFSKEQHWRVDFCFEAFSHSSLNQLAKIWLTELQRDAEELAILREAVEKVLQADERISEVHRVEFDWDE